MAASAAENEILYPRISPMLWLERLAEQVLGELPALETGETRELPGRVIPAGVGAILSLVGQVPTF